MLTALESARYYRNGGRSSTRKQCPMMAALRSVTASTTLASMNSLPRKKKSSLRASVGSERMIRSRASRDETRREHALELQSVSGYRPFTIAEYRRLRGWLTDLALQTNKALALAEQLIESLRSQRVIVPAVTMIDRLCAEALARGVKLLYING